MKKWLAIFMAAVWIVAAVTVAFAVDLSEYHFVSPPDFFAQYDLGNGRYLIPVDDLSNSVYSQSLNTLIARSSDKESYYTFFVIYKTSSRYYLTISVFPKNNINFYQILESHGSYSNCMHFYCDVNNSHDTKSKVISSASFSFPFDTGSFKLNTCYIDNYSSVTVFKTCDLRRYEHFFYFSNDNLFSVLESSSNNMTSCNFISGVSNLKFIDKNDYIPVSSYNLTINYQYSNGDSALDPVVQPLEPGAEYSVPSPAVEGYAPDIPLVTGTMPEHDLTVTVTYTRAFYPLTVQYRYADGTKALDDAAYQYPSGFVYDIPTPELAGYVPDKPKVAGIMPGNALTETVTYTGKPFTLTVRYQYENGSMAASDHQEQLLAGASYSVPSPVLQGYTPDLATAAGVMPAKDLLVTVIYKADAGSGGEGEGPGGSGGGGSEGDDPFELPVQPPFSGYDPFVIPGLPPWSGYDPFKINGLPPYSYDPFMIPGKEGGRE